MGAEWHKPNFIQHNQIVLQPLGLQTRPPFFIAGTGVSIAANKVPGICVAFCHDAETAKGARLWNRANVLCLSLRAPSEIVAKEIPDACDAAWI